MIKVLNDIYRISNIYILKVRHHGFCFDNISSKCYIIKRQGKISINNFLIRKKIT